MNSNLDKICQDLKLSDGLANLIAGYLQLNYEKLETLTPYWRDKFPGDKEKNIRGFLGGKGRPREIADEVKKQLDLLPIEERPKTNGELFDWMKRKRIGVDCSGLAFALLKRIAEDKGDESWESRLVPTSGGNPQNEKRFRTSARTLCGQENADEVARNEDLKLGDLVRLEGGKHVMVVLGETENDIWYMHSSALTEISGAHLGVMKRKVEEIGKFEFDEQLKNGANLESLWEEENGDGVFRMKGW